MLTPDEATARVAKGAALLDQKLPGWAQKVDVGRLELSDCRVCVLGQLGNALPGDEMDRYDAMAKLIWLMADEGAYLWPRLFGFDVSLAECRMSEKQVAYGLLQDAWIVAICDRLVPSLPAPVAIPVEG